MAEGGDLIFRVTAFLFLKIFFMPVGEFPLS